MCYPLAAILAVSVAAVRSGCRSFTAVGEWIADLDHDALMLFGLSRAPGESNLRKLFARLDATAFDKCLGAFAFTRTHHVAGRRVIALDGKTLRGARAGAAPAPHLIAALDHRAGVVVAQLAVDAKSNWISAVRDVLAGFDPEDLAGGPCRENRA